MRKILSIFLVILPLLSVAQFAPPAGQEGTTAMHADSSAFIAWATGCVVDAGPMNISNPSLGVAGAGYPAENAIGAPDGTYGVACLGDGGVATLTFDSPIVNGPGPDFAVFENGFKSGANYFLEIAFVEVSSDGEHFFRFPAITNVPYDTQLGGFATMDPTLIHNFAGKYEAFYGTPFDLDEVEDNPLLNKNNVTHVRVIDVVGCIQPEYATHDSQGHPVNDPWPTPFASSGFDLDAVGVIHDQAHQVPEDATIDPSEILYWIGTGSHEAIFAVNWNNPDVCYAWGYRFSAKQVTVKDMMDEIAATDGRFNYELGTYGVGDITFDYGEEHLALFGMYWMYNVNGEQALLGFETQTVSNGDFVKWGDESCGTPVSEWGLVWETPVQPVSVYNSVAENATGLTIYPNPAHNTLSVQAENVISMTVCSLMGQQLLTSEGCSIDVSMLPQGVYMVLVLTDGKTYVNKFVKE